MDRYPVFQEDLIMPPKMQSVPQIDQKIQFNSQ